MKPVVLQNSFRITAFSPFVAFTYRRRTAVAYSSIAERPILPLTFGNLFFEATITPFGNINYEADRGIDEPQLDDIMH